MSEPSQAPHPCAEAPANTATAPTPLPAFADDLRTAQALRAGDEAAFVALIDRYHVAMLRLALVYVSDRAVAEEVVQDAWIRVLRGIHGYAGRAALKTWLFHILVNCAKTRAQRERRSVPFSALADDADDADEAPIDADRFLPPDAPRHPGGWLAPPHAWDELPEERLLSRETYARVEHAIVALPPRQREVITLRDIEEWTAEEVCNFLGLSESNQRVLLHRARLRVRQEIERYLREE
ncbi:MAG: sigma-70 family RNA polymerase sigma factor [Ktedonobacterales bacterium]|nr:sigma-70 family RNA polymerase sigma factor [Ktedonobacterales bacterium]